MVLDPGTWPTTGRIGQCRAGEAEGCLIFLHLATEDLDPSLAYWQAFFRPPVRSTEDDEFFVDHASGAMQTFLAAADVDWVPESTDAEFEDKHMGLRRHFAINGSPIYADFIDRLNASKPKP
jgi:hypothetical protein